VQANMHRFSRTEMPFLSIITMAYKRPVLLARNQAMLARQTCQDFEQIVIEDSEGRGWPWVAEQYRVVAGEVRGRYVMYVEDDDQLASADTVAYLREAVEMMDVAPDVIVVKFGMIWRSGRSLTIPEPEYWDKPPIKGTISGQCIVAKRAVWQKHAPQFGPDGDDNYSIDIRFIQSILNESNGHLVLWLPCMISKMQVRGFGRTEEQMSGSRAVAAGGR